MANLELIAYIKEQLKAGVSHEDIKAALLSAGWDQETIDNSFSDSSLIARSSRPTWNKILIVIFAAAIISLAINGTYYFWTKAGIFSSAETSYKSTEGE